MTNVKYILFDAANTLIHKPGLWARILSVFEKNDIVVPLDRLKYHHKILSEYIDFPDQTSKAFYDKFNKELLLSFGIQAEERLLDDIFKECTYLPWEAFEDTVWLDNCRLPMGVLSNFNKSLPKELDRLFGNIFSNVFVSEDLQKRKPDQKFYELAIKLIGIPPEEILYIGDSYKLDMIPALDINLNSLLIDRIGIYSGNKNTISSLSQIDKYIS